MSLSIERFDEFFHTLWGYDPFPWQSRLARQVFDQNKGWPGCIDLPTASGKTTCIDIAVFVLACQADWETKDRTVGRRIFFTVNRRVIVDEAFDRSLKLAKELSKAKNGILREVADALREVSGDEKAPPLDVAQLRGGVYRDRAWARSITQPIVVCTTADQLGSRLLFRGYGVSASSAPIHAALCGCDSLVLLDEAHVTRAFSQTLQLLMRYQAQHATAPKMGFVQMTATPTSGVKSRFGLERADRSHPVLKARQEASKPAALVKLDKKKSIVEEAVTRAFGMLSDSPKAVGIIVNRVQTAREIERHLLEEVDKRRRKDETFEAEVHLIIGRMRPIDRDDLQEKLRSLVGPSRPAILTKNVFVVATQCLEVGADYDFDVLLTECAALDALRQRFGRLNRKGRPIEAMAAIITNDESLKGDDPIYGDAIKHTWEWLWSKKDENKQVDFGIAAFKPLWEEVENEHAVFLDENCSKPLFSPTRNAAVLLPAHLDALCQTNPPPVPSPDVSYFIHGPQRDNADVNVCWRADLGPDDDSAKNRWPEIVRLLPPTSSECMTVPLIVVKRWMGERFKSDADADVAIAIPEQVEEKPSKRQFPPVRFVAWRGSKDCKVVESSAELRPNDTIVIRTQDFGWESLGHIPTAPARAAWEELLAKTDEAGMNARTEIEIRRDCVDQAERAIRQTRLRVAVRLHSVFPGRAELRGRTTDELRMSLGSLIEKELDGYPEERDRIKAVLSSRIERHDYPNEQDESPESKPNQIITFKSLLPPKDKLPIAPIDDDDGDDDLSEANRFISLDEHTRHVVERLNLALGRLHLNKFEPPVRASAPLHDIGKTDSRFQAMLAGVTPYEAMMLPTPLGKGDGVRRTIAERDAIFERALYPRGFRHEMLSVELTEHLKLEAGLPQRDLLLHLIAAHHGYARPFAPVCIDDAVDEELRSIRVNGSDISGSERKAWIPSHRLDSGIAERFWTQTRAHGWWGLAWLEAILRLADQQASAAEQMSSYLETHDE